MAIYVKCKDRHAVISEISIETALELAEGELSRMIQEERVFIEAAISHDKKNIKKGQELLKRIDLISTKEKVND
jgi:hypothetical protein